MSAVEVGGHLLVATPCNNQVGHGFYQFSPELLFRALSPENGFQTRIVLVRDSHRYARWRRVRDPAEVGGRVRLRGPWPTTIWALARRTSDVPPFASWPQQSDYVSRWRGARRRAAPTTRLPAPLRRVAGLVQLVTGTTSARGDFQPVELRSLELAG
jgi:hypothetical protein